jgi:predicted HAD superfamily phosphohydrolase YqeG
MDKVEEDEVLEKAIDLEITKKHLGIKKVLIFDLDETLAHCVR